MRGAQPPEGPPPAAAPRLPTAGPRRLPASPSPPRRRAATPLPPLAPALAVSLKEIDLWKESRDIALGMTLAMPHGAKAGVAPPEGISVASLVPGGLVAKSNRLRAGDVLLAVNGVKARVRGSNAGR